MNNDLMFLVLKKENKEEATDISIEMQVFLSSLVTVIDKILG